MKPDTELEKVRDEFIRGYLTARPLRASALGFHDHDGRINEHTRLAIDAELARLKRFDDRLNKFDTSKLSPRSRIDLRLLRVAISNELFFMQDLAIYERNPMSYANALDVSIYAKRKYAPIEDRVRSAIAVENQAPNIIIAAKTNLVRVLPKPYVELAIKMARDASEFLKNNFAAAFTELKDEGLRIGFMQSNRRAATALSDYANWLEKERLPKATPEFAIGREKYERFLAQAELIDLPLDKILELGLAELKYEQGIFADAAKRLDSDKPALEVFREIQSEHPAAGDLLPEITKTLEEVHRYVIDNKLVTVPSEVRPRATETPLDQRTIALASLDAPGPFEKRVAEAYFYVTPPEEEWTDEQKNRWLAFFNPYGAGIIAMRETYPGRYVQQLHLSASKATKMEKIFGAASFVEGWAQYAEQMTIDAGFGNPFQPNPTDDDIRRGAKYRMAQAQRALVNLGRLCVSIKMHTQRMSVTDAARFFQENCYCDETLARIEAMDATFDFSSATGALGKLQILRLRKDYEIQEGEDFSLKKFHDQLLDHGMLPIRLLREVLLKDETKWDDLL